MRTKITARFVVGYEGGDHVIYRDGEVVYEDDRIVWVGHSAPRAPAGPDAARGAGQARTAGAASVADGAASDAEGAASDADGRGGRSGFAEEVDRTIEAGDAIVSPGFIDLNALADIDHGILDTFQGPELSLGLQWSEEYFLHRRRELFSPDEDRFQRRYALIQLLLNGITTAMPIAAETYREWCETYEQLADVARIAGELGIRMYLGPAYRSGINVVRADGSRDVLWDHQRGEDGLEQAVRFVRDFEGQFDGRVRGAFLPCRIETVTLDLLRATKRQADELGCPIKLHAAQGLPELALIQRWYGKRSIELLGEIGLLGPNLAIPHVYYIGGRNGVEASGADELALLRDSGATVVHCPIPGARHARSLDTLEAYLTGGVNVAIGTDMFPPDIIRALDYGSNMAKQRAGSQTAGAPADLFRAATLGGARMLGRDDLGRLAPGAKADITVIDLSGLRTGPIEDPIRTLLMNGNGRDVKTVIVDGRTVVEDGTVPGLDVEAMRRRAQAYFETYRAAYSERDYLRRSPEELFPPTFRVVDG